jgi:hypothetical protein
MADVLGTVRRWIRRLGGEPEAEEVSASLKRLAEQQPVTIKLSADQISTLKDQWRSLDPSRPAAISFEVEGRQVADFKVASCAYWGDTCCA